MSMTETIIFRYRSSLFWQYLPFANVIFPPLARQSGQNANNFVFNS